MTANGAQLLGPLLLVLVALGGLALFMRWGFGAGRPPAVPTNEGLLVVIATLAQRESALALRALLADAGIRSRLRFPAAYRADVLVFPEDAPRARQLAATFAPD